MILRIKKLIALISRSKLAFFILGGISLAWFLIRVIPKPSRAAYPCMRATAPFMSAFVMYLLSLFATIHIMKKYNARRYTLRFAPVFAFLLVALFSFIPGDEILESRSPAAAFELVPAGYFKANSPMGVAQGVFPGRVVWVYDPNVTNAAMTNKAGDYWYMDKNCNQALTDSMLVSGIRRVGGKSNIKEAWTEIFTYFNQTHGRGTAGYKAGEKISIKINLTNSCCNGGVANDQMDASPQMVLAIIRQLVDVVGVAQSDIWMGDPYRQFRNEYYNKCHAVYPDVHYIDAKGGNGREVTIPSANQALVFSDKQNTASLPQHFLDATYFINMPCLKSHNEGGITIAAKNHQGSILNTANGDIPAGQSAYYMHYALPVAPDGSQGTNLYRHLVDYMGHKDLGGKTLLYVVDALWSGKSWNGIVEKWKISPFNNDYTSSVFLSQDAVAIESVGFDFLLAEYALKPDAEKYPYMLGLDDYMKQAADPANWPAGIIYDPEDDGIPIGSLGVYEHWNSVATKQYTRNLGTGNGIELKSYTALPVDNYVSEKVNTGIEDSKNLNINIYPNPFTTNITIETGLSSSAILSIINMQGQVVYQRKIAGNYKWNGMDKNGEFLKNGNYILQLKEIKSGKTVNYKIIHQ
jgi:hypothetical protein